MVDTAMDESETFVGITMPAQHHHVYQPLAMDYDIVYQPNPPFWMIVFGEIAEKSL